MNVLPTAGVLYAIVGAITATIFLYAGPPLLHSYTASAPGDRAGITLAFTTLTGVIYRGLWQTLELIPLAAWAIGTGRLLRARSRGLGTVGVMGGAGALLVALGRMSQAPTAVIAIFLCLFALNAAFQIWLGAVLLWDSGRL